MNYIYERKLEEITDKAYEDKRQLKNKLAYNWYDMLNAKICYIGIGFTIGLILTYLLMRNA